MLKLIHLLLSKFYSKDESASVAHQAFPAVSFVDFETIDPRIIRIELDTTETSEDNAWLRFGYYTAPTDGYIQFQGISTSEDLSYLQCDGLWRANAKDVVVRGFFPIAKGNTVSLSGSYMKDVQALFVKAIGSCISGGGYVKRFSFLGGVYA